MNDIGSTPAAWLAEGERLLLARDLDGALHAFTRALALDPTLADGWREKGMVLLELGSYQEAVEHLDRALDIEPKDGDAWNYRGQALAYL